MQQTLKDLIEASLLGKKQAAMARDLGLPESTLSEALTVLKSKGDSILNHFGLKVVPKELKVYPPDLVDALLTVNRHCMTNVTAEQLSKDH